MAMPSKNSSRADTIVHAAGQLFARQGYHGTTTRQIARLAEVSENALFRHFNHKEEIFWAALRAQIGQIKLRRDLQSALAGGHGPDEVVPEIVSMLVDTIVFRPDLVRLMAVAFLELGWKASSICNEYITPLILVIGEYFKTSIETGKMRNLDPTMVLAALGMTVMIHPEVSRLVRGGLPPHSDRGEAIEAYTKFWMDVLAPPGPRIEPVGHAK
jgi:AcrR family transcriptional regulator